MILSKMNHFINLKDIKTKDLRKIILAAKKRKNLKVFTEAFVEKIIFDGRKAIGIEVKIKNKVEKI